MDSREASRLLSPLRRSTSATTVSELVAQQLRHFQIDPDTEFGASLARTSQQLYELHGSVHEVWQASLKSLPQLEAADRIARFNALKFLSFQIAKVLDTVQNPFRASYQSLGYTPGTLAAKGPYPIFDNVTALFSATPVIARTATYIYACAEWVEDAFKGKELMLEIYSRLLNPTSISLANFVVDLEAGPYSHQYLAWNFNSGMAAIDGVLAHLLGREDILLTSRNIYGGAYQLIHDWYAKPSNLNIAVVTFDGFSATDLQRCLEQTLEQYAERIAAGRQLYLYLESPCNPHGDFLDLPAMCHLAHQHGIRVVLDATVGTPFLVRPLQREDASERPDFVVHSYTKDMTGTGTAIAGCVIGRNEDMFVPKGETVADVAWSNTLFWNVYYVKGAFLNADAAFEVIQGMRTLEMRMLPKCITTLILANYLNAHPQIHVRSSALPTDPNANLRRKLAYLQLPAPLMTFHMSGIGREVFQRFFDALAPTFEHMISLGQSNTIVSCPALTTHSELSAAALHDSGIEPTTVRIAVGDEDVVDLIRHITSVCRLVIDRDVPGFSSKFMPAEDANRMIEQIHLQVHRDFVRSRRL